MIGCLVGRCMLCVSVVVVPWNCQGVCYTSKGGVCFCVVATGPLYPPTVHYEQCGDCLALLATRACPHVCSVAVCLYEVFPRWRQMSAGGVLTIYLLRTCVGVPHGCERIGALWFSTRVTQPLLRITRCYIVGLVRSVRRA